jgi:hypothetical protein
MWRGGKCIRPYFLDVKLIVDNQHTIDLFRQPYLSDSAPNPIGGGSPGGVVTGSSLSRSTAVPVPVQRNSRPNLPNNGHNCFKRVVPPERLGFIHFPIEDCNVTDDTGVLLLARQLVYDISRGDVLYLHCWGGHGRTGTVVCLMLHLMYGISAVEAMRRCQAAHDLRQYPVKVGSPQTETQRSQVARIIAVLEEQQRAEAARAQAHAEAMQQLDAQVEKGVAPPDVLEDTDDMTVAGPDRSSPDVMRMEVDAHLQAQLQPTVTVTGTGTAGSGVDTGTAIPIPTSGNPSNLSGRVRARAAGDAGNALANQQPPAATAGAKSDQARSAAAVAVVATPSKIPVRTGANSAGLGGLGAGYAPAAPSSTTPSSNATLGGGGGGGGGGGAGSSSAGSEADSLQKGGLHRFRQQWRTPTGGNSVDTSVDGAATSPLPSSVACTVPSTPTPAAAAAAAAATPAAGSGTGGLSKIFNNYIGLNDPSPNPNANPNAAVQQGVEAALADASATGTGTGTVALVGASAAPVRQVRRGDSGLAFTGAGSHHRVPAIATQAAAADGAGIAIPSPIETAPPTILPDGSGSAVSSPVIAQKTKVARTTPTPTKEGQTTSFAEKDGLGLGLTAGPCL